MTIILAVQHFDFFTENLTVSFSLNNSNDITYSIILIGLVWLTLFLYLTDLPLIKIISTSVFIIAFFSGFYGFYCQSYEKYDRSFSNALYSTIHLFILTFDSVFNESGNMYGKLPLSIEIARFLAPLSTVLAIWIIGLRYFNQTVKIFTYRLFGNHILIIGSSEKASILAANLKEDGYKVVLIDETLSTDKQEQFNEWRLAFIKGRENSAKLYKKSGLSLTKHVILLNDDDSLNLDNYLSVKKYLEQNPRKIRFARVKKFFRKKDGIQNQMQILLHLNHAKALEIFEGLKKIDTEEIRTYSFSAYQLKAEKMLSDQPLYKSYEEQLRNLDGKPLHLLFIGFGKTNQFLAYHALNLGHFFTKEPMKITVLDRNIEKVMKEFKFLANDYGEVAKIDPRPVDLSAMSIKTAIEGIQDEITHVFLGLTDDFLDMIEGIEVAKVCPNVPIFIKMKDDREVSIVLDNDQGAFKRLKRYAFLSEVLTADYVLNETLQTIAKEAHENYCKLKKTLRNEDDKSWEALNSFKQESTRFQMLHNETKLMLLGLEKVRLEDPLYEDSVLDDFRYRQYVDDYTEELAIVEHQRWNAFHYLRGWRTAGEQDGWKRNEENRKGLKDDLAKIKLHPDLVDWDELSDTSKQYDKESIERLREYYEAQGYGLIES